MDKASFIITVVIEGVDHSVYVMKRPGVDEFIKRMANCYEVWFYGLNNAYFYKLKQ